MILLDKVRWGSYQDYEGPWYGGEHKLATDLTRVPQTSFNYKALSVITATEGGHFDAINMYDRMICSVGLIQWGDAGQFSVCSLLGQVAGRDTDALSLLREYIAKRGYTFQSTSQGWRFVKEGNVVDTIGKQREFYLAGSTGKKGNWTEDQKQWARGFVVALQSVWDSPEARDMQVEFTCKRLKGFAMKNSHEGIFLDPAARVADQRIVEAAQAAFLSFAVNLPAVADKHFAIYQATTTAKKWTIEWLNGLLKQLTFGPNITIYPHRYRAIRPVIEKLWNIDLPDTSEDLKAWQSAIGIAEGLLAPKEVQKILIQLKYDLGPSGADGIVGPKTREALYAFQSKLGLNASGVVDAQTSKALSAAASELSPS
jgi:hypothetical protein